MIKAGLHIGLILLLELFTCYGLQAQDTINDPDFLDIDQELPALVNDVPNPNIKNQNKVNYHVQLGANYLVSNRVFGPGYYFSPSASYDATKRLNLTVGTGFGYQQFHAVSEDGTVDILPMMSYFIYTQGAYKVNENLIVDGSVSYTRNDVPNPNKDETDNQNNAFQNDITGYSLGFTYKIRPNVTFGVHFDYSNSPYNFYNQYDYYSNPYNYHNTVFNQLFEPYYKTSPFGYGYY